MRTQANVREQTSGDYQYYLSARSGFGRRTVGGEKRERQRPGFGCGHRVVARPDIAKETVIGVGEFNVHKSFFRRAKRVSHRANDVWTEMLIASAPNQHHGSA